MTDLEIIQLVNNKAAADLTLKEADAVRAKLEESPYLSRALGEHDWVEEYLAGLPKAGDLPRKEARDDIQDASALKSNEPATGVAAVHSRRWQLLGVCLVLLLGGVFGIYAARNRDTNKDPAGPIADAKVQADATADIPKEIDAIVAKPAKPQDSNQAEPPDTLKPEDQWKGWTFRTDQGAMCQFVREWDFSQPLEPRPMENLLTGQGRVILSREHKLAPTEAWLRMQLRHFQRDTEPGTVEVRSDGRPIARFELLEFAEHGEFAVPVTQLREPAKFEVIYQPGGEKEQVVWQAIAFAENVQSPDGSVVVVPRLADATAGAEPPTTIDPGPHKVVHLIPSPYEMFEDEGKFSTADSASTGSATLLSEDKYTGAAAIRVTPEGQFRRELPRKIVISQQPGPGEFRYLRFAVRVHGGGGARLRLDVTDAADVETSYEMGDPGKDPRPKPEPKMIPIGPDKDRWVVVTRDLFRDFGRIELTGLSLSKRDGGRALFDHVYLARKLSDFDRAPQPADANLANHVAVPKAVGPESTDLAQTVVAISYAGQLATGVIVSENGYIITAGHLVSGSSKEAMIYMLDGSRERAEVIALKKDFDVGLLKIRGRPRYFPYAKMAKASNFGSNRTYRAFSHRYAYKPGEAPEEIVVLHTTPFFGYAKVGSVQSQFTEGGPVFEPGGELIGIHIGADRGAMRYREIEYFTMYWDKLTAGIQP